MNMNKFKVFVDFDGTITKIDVGEAIFREFGNAEETDKIVADLLSNKITARKCWELLFATIERIDTEKLDEFIGRMNIDPTFHQFHKYCSDNNIDLIVLSDGFDYYINQIFNKENLNHVKIFAKLELSGNFLTLFIVIHENGHIMKTNWCFLLLLLFIWVRVANPRRGPCRAGR